MEPFGYLHYALTNFARVAGAPFYHGTGPGLMALTLSMDFLGLDVVFTPGPVNINRAYIAMGVIFAVVYGFFGERRYHKNAGRYAKMTRRTRRIADAGVLLFVSASMGLCYYIFTH